MTDSVSQDPTVVLLPAWDRAEPRVGAFVLADGVTIPGGWEPDPKQYAPKALPTPFARAEATRLVLSKIDVASSHRYAQLFSSVLLGIASGVLEVEPKDLESGEYDNLGRALMQVEPKARYFATVTLVEGTRRRIYAISYYSSLISPHARRSEDDWKDLEEKVKVIRPRGMQLLADWRESLVRCKRWAPGEKNCEWQRGIDNLVAGVTPSPDLVELRRNCKLVGPVWLCLPTGQSEPPVRCEPVYLPSLFDEYASTFSRLCYCKPRLDQAQRGITLNDANDKMVAKICLPEAGLNLSPLAMGLGQLTVVDTPKSQAKELQLWLEDRGNEPGLVRLLKSHVIDILIKQGRPVEESSVNACPVLYPDPIRLLFELGMWPGSEGRKRIQSQRLAEAILADGGRVPSEEQIAREEGEILPLGSGDKQVSVVLLDTLGGRQILDLRALGYVLWTVFNREAAPSPELSGRLATMEELKIVLDHNPERPLEPQRWVYDEVVSLPPSESLRCRLATMQRFVSAYPLPAGPEALPRVLAKAVRSFVAWAAGRNDVVPLGRPPMRLLKHRLPTGEELNLAIDSVGHPAV